MIAFLVLIGSLAVYGQDHGHVHVHGPNHNHSCVHNNHQQLQADQVIISIIADMEKDGDGIVEQTEVEQEFVQKYDHDNSGDVDEKEFVNQWHKQYHDAPDFAGYLFHHFDSNSDQKLTAIDTVNFIKGADADGNGRVSIAEFQAFLTNHSAIYTLNVKRNVNLLPQ